MSLPCRSFPLLCLSSALLARAAVPDQPDAAGDLGARVERAVERGRIELLRRLEGLLGETAADYPIGRLAFPTTALLKAGVPADDPLIAAAFDKLAGLKVEKTYCAACYLFALDALWRAQPGTADSPEAARGRTSVRASRQATGDIRKKIDELVRWLINARIRGHGSWTYEMPQKGDRHDFSNTQFAALGIQIGLQHGIEVPREVFTDLARLFTGAITREGAPEEVEITLETSLEAKLGITRVIPTRKQQEAQGGWGYTDPRRGKGRQDAPYPSMTAAGASCIIIGINGLKEARGLAKDDVKAIQEAERALQAAYAWIAKRFDLYIADGRQVHYTLYSLEKVGDLGGIEKFGGRDWYSEGAERILRSQRANGGWGSYSDTAFALLFLKRATRRLEAAAAPRIVTGARKEGLPPGSDLVYIDQAKGFLSARALLRYIGDARRAELVPVAEEVIRNYPLNSKEDLVATLVGLWTKPDRVTATARKALVEITGIKADRPDAYASWEKELGELRSLEAKEKVEPAEITRAIRGSASPRIRARLAGLAQRLGFRALAGMLVEELAVADVEYRRRLHGILALWTGQTLVAPANDDESAWAATARAWQDWWLANGAAWEASLK